MPDNASNFCDLLCHYLDDGPVPLSVRALASQSGVSFPYISDCRRGYRAPDKRTAARWAVCLQVANVKEWMELAAIARARLTATGKEGSKILSERLFESELRLQKMQEQHTHLLRQHQLLLEQFQLLVSVARKSGLQIPDALR